ncbi:hypothetical protein, partial [Frankia sp. CiP3]|uniref:hypothetical protein n=1 Tax=Frankia sp. CiP3 TaxID=2880971 RepID=UPI001EF444BB
MVGRVTLIVAGWCRQVTGAVWTTSESMLRRLVTARGPPSRLSTVLYAPGRWRTPAAWAAPVALGGFRLG